MFEWNLDWYATYVDPCVDCASLTTNPYGRGKRGNQFDYYATYYMLVPYREYGPVAVRDYGTGFRCARTP
jgi:hypothetical protein